MRSFKTPLDQDDMLSLSRKKFSGETNKKSLGLRTCTMTGEHLEMDNHI